MSFDALAPPKEVKAEIVNGNGAAVSATHQGVIELAIQRLDGFMESEGRPKS